MISECWNCTLVPQRVVGQPQNEIKNNFMFNIITATHIYDWNDSK